MIAQRALRSSPRRLAGVVACSGVGRQSFKQRNQHRAIGGIQMLGKRVDRTAHCSPQHPHLGFAAIGQGDDRYSTIFAVGLSRNKPFIFKELQDPRNLRVVATHLRAEVPSHAGFIVGYGHHDHATKGPDLVNVLFDDQCRNPAGQLAHDAVERLSEPVTARRISCHNAGAFRQEADRRRIASLGNPMQAKLTVTDGFEMRALGLLLSRSRELLS